MSMEEIRYITTLASEIRKDIERAKYLYEKATCVASANSTAERIQESTINRAGLYVEAAVDLENEARAKAARLKELQDQAKEAFEALEGKAARICRRRYIDLMDWQTIAELEGYTIRRVRQIERNALISTVTA